MDIGDLYTTLGFPHRQGSLRDAERSFWVEPLMFSVKLIAGCSDEEQGVHMLDGKLPGPPQCCTVSVTAVQHTLWEIPFSAFYVLGGVGNVAGHEGLWTEVLVALC